MTWILRWASMYLRFFVHRGLNYARNPPPLIMLLDIRLPEVLIQVVEISLNRVFILISSRFTFLSGHLQGPPQARLTSPGMTPPTFGWTLPNKSLVKKILYIYLMTWGSLLSGNSNLRQMDTKQSSTLTVDQNSCQSFLPPRPCPTDRSKATPIIFYRKKIKYSKNSSK